MVTLVDMIRILAPVALGSGFGSYYCSRHGFVGGALGGTFGTVLGVLAGWGVLVLIDWKVGREMSRKSEGDLRKGLRGPDWSVYSLYLEELDRRGADIESECEPIKALLIEDDKLKRVTGYKMLRRHYPRLVAELTGFDPYKSVEECRSVVGRKDNKII